MASSRPKELEQLLEAKDPASTRKAWEAFLRRYSLLLLSVTRSASADYDGSMDRYGFILEELQKDGCSRLRAYSADPRSRFSTWLVVVSRRLCVDYHRHRYGRKRPTGREAENSKAVRRRLVDMMMEELDPARTGDPISTNPEDKIRAKELSGVLEDAVAGLSSEDRLLIRLRFEDGLPAKAIAQTMRYPTVFHVYRRLNSLLNKLRSELGARGVYESVP